MAVTASMLRLPIHGYFMSANRCSQKRDRKEKKDARSIMLQEIYRKPNIQLEALWPSFFINVLLKKKLKK
uniref:Uncharacterized protein n=1 Tax=Panagrolaimus sp. JU765 TaxID=591449 RepID=A0AC34QP14_9BILA